MYRKAAKNSRKFYTKGEGRKEGSWYTGGKRRRLPAAVGYGRSQMRKGEKKP